MMAQLISTIITAFQVKLKDINKKYRTMMQHKALNQNDNKKSKDAPKRPKSAYNIFFSMKGRRYWVKFLKSVPKTSFQ